MSRCASIERLEDRTLLASVAVFDNPAFVDTTSFGVNAESDNVQASLRSFGHTVTTFTSISAAGFQNALAGRDVLLIPEQENGNLAAALSSQAISEIQNFVATGGGLIVHGGPFSSTFLNTVFGFSTFQSGIGTLPFFRTPIAAGTEFANGPEALPSNNQTSFLDLVSLPIGTRAVYASGTVSAVNLMPFGDGEIVYLGWDWWNALPIGNQDGGWLQVLNASVQEITATQITIDDATVLEGDGETVNANFTVRLSEPLNQTVTVTFTTIDGTATVADNDYVPVSGALSFLPGTTSRTISVRIVGDQTVERNETFRVRLTNVVTFGRNMRVANDEAIGTIRNDDEARLSINNVSMAEGDEGLTSFVFTVRLDRAVDIPLLVNYATTDLSARAGSDYGAQSSTLGFRGLAGEMRTITIAVLGDREPEANEQFGVQLSDVQALGRNVTISGGLGIGTILNDDPVSPPAGSVSQTEVWPPKVPYTIATKQDWSVEQGITPDPAATGRPTTADGSVKYSLNRLLADKLLADSRAVQLRATAKVATPDPFINEEETLLENPFDPRAFRRQVNLADDLDRSVSTPYAVPDRIFTSAKEMATILRHP